MSGYLDQEAEESDYESESEQQQPRKKKLRIDNDDDEEDEDDEDEEELKDLINDEEEEENEDAAGERDKESEEEQEEDLDDDDLDLLEENLGVKLKRPTRKFKRVKKFVDSDEDEPDERTAIEQQLFDDKDDDEDERDARSASRRYEEQLEEGSEESDEDNFIVDDQDRPISRPRKRRSKYPHDEALQQAQDVFGFEFDFSEFENYDNYDEDEDEEDEYEDEEEEGETPRQRRSKASRKSQRKSIYEVYEPAELEKNFLNERDKEITASEQPERFLLRSTPVVHLIPTAEDPELRAQQEIQIEKELTEESKWIYDCVFFKPPISQQVRNFTNAALDVEPPVSNRQDPEKIEKVKNVLRFIRTQLLEVPFISFYRKEYVEGLTIDDLWSIFKADEKWCQLQQRKQNLKKLIQDMRKYQEDLIIARPDEPLGEDNRIISSADIVQVDKVKSFEELRDCQVQFQLYYGSDFPKMKQARIRAEKEKRTEVRLANKEESERVFLEEEELMNQKLSSLKLAQRKDPYTICKENGILGVASRFGLTPEQFGENMAARYQKFEVEQIPINPEEFASDYVCPKFSRPSDVLEAAKYVIARQFSSNPKARQTIRAAFEERALLHCKPTKKGLKEIDENHPCHRMKYLRNKPVRKLYGTDFLNMVIAEKDGLLEIDITMDPKRNEDEKEGHPTTTYLDDMKSNFTRDEFSTNVQKWNNFRIEALKLTLDKFILLDLKTELKGKLLRESQDGIVKMACKKLFDYLKIGPYKVDTQIANEEGFDLRDGIRILGIALANHSDGSSFAALVDGDGEFSEHIKLPLYMLKRGEKASEKEKELRDKDKDNLRRFILEKRPHVICVGAKSLVCRDIVQDLVSIVQDLVETESFPNIPTELVDDELSLVYMNSKRAVADFPDFPPTLRQAISLARRLQDPLIEFSQLCTPDEELLCLKFHPLQDHIAKDELIFNLELEFINRVNEVGVDVNRTLVHSHTAQLVQFICGLGPRKSAALLRNLKRANPPLLETRDQLAQSLDIPMAVFQNCAAFIKIDTAAISDLTDKDNIEVLDSTRIHPEAYDLARKMAVDALEYEDNSVPTSNAVEDIMENPENLKDLDLDAFAAQLEKEKCGPKKITLYDIREELTHPFRDHREPYPLPTSEQIFQLLTKETPETFYKGKLVLGTVLGISRRKPEGPLDENNPIKNEETGLWQCPVCRKSDFLELNEVWNHYDAEMCPGEAMGIRIKLDNGLIGMVPLELISNSEVIDPSDRVKPGMTIHARIVDINVEKFHVKLTCRSSDLNNKSHHFTPTKDEFYDYDAEDQDTLREEEKLKKKATKQTYIKRIIVHPSFQNIDYQESERLMSKANIGEAIFRPSSKGPDHLTLTWKVCEGVLQHFDILERNKDNDFSLGHQLIINGEIYEDLDEIIARFVTPMALLANEVCKYRRFHLDVYGNKELAERIVREEKLKNPKFVPYIVSPCKDFPGKFLLSYLPKEKCYHEFISITPSGLKFRGHIFKPNASTRRSSIDYLVEWFKKHFRDVPAPRTAMGTPGLARMGMTPMASPAVSAAAAAAAARMRTPNPGLEWARQAATWQRPVMGRTPSYATPGASSQMSISPRPAGDQTPLMDEF
ncbi:transcription elongation factor Spt6 isoform X2 [Brevipalpus obovatus]|uniref:transcription elongation factor Spt6 isoform X2 n=1 Tax=Brevipalpus obovatus TaxID=246614 RepID=UPI003D9E782C